MNTLLGIYKNTISPLLLRFFGGGCRYSPTCSEYLVGAVKKHGILYGAVLGIKRIARCHPFFKADYFDPIK